MTGVYTHIPTYDIAAEVKGTLKTARRKRLLHSLEFRVLIESPVLAGIPRFWHASVSRRPGGADTIDAHATATKRRGVWAHLTVHFHALESKTKTYLRVRQAGVCLISKDVPR